MVLLTVSAGSGIVLLTVSEGRYAGKSRRGDRYAYCRDGLQRTQFLGRGLRPLSSCVISLTSFALHNSPISCDPLPGVGWRVFTAQGGCQAWLVLRTIRRLPGVCPRVP
jgi:hypothetical protein